MEQLEKELNEVNNKVPKLVMRQIQGQELLEGGPRAAAANIQELLNR
jgi:hypothetical protein